MPGLSQRTVAHLINVFEELGCFDDNSYTGIHKPLVSATDLKRELYARNFDPSLLDKWVPANPYAKSWDFAKIFPRLYDGSFLNSPLRTRNWRAALEDEEAPIRQQESIAKGRRLLLDFAEYLFDKSHVLPRLKDSAALNQLSKSLELDGFRLLQGKLIPADTAVFDQPKEASFLIEQIRVTNLASEQTLLHHFTNGEQEYLQGKPDTAMGEWRKFLERLLRDIAEETGRNRTDLTVDATKLNMKDLFQYLHQAAFLDADEKLAFSSVWGFLCSGAHPGIGTEDKAYLAMILSLTFSNTALRKFQKWQARGYNGF